MKGAALLVAVLAGRVCPTTLTAEQWTDVIAIARAEVLLGTLACRLDGRTLPDSVSRLMADQRASAHVARTQAVWEADMARRALNQAQVEFVLLKGTAYAAAKLRCAEGRQIGDLDILVPTHALGRAENALLAAGWEWVKPDPYDDAYYRDHMHELPPLIHRDRDRMIDVHHTILPRTHRITPDELILVSDAVHTENGFSVLCPVDMLCHCAAHLLADGDLQGGLRNLWDYHCLLQEYATADAFWDRLLRRAQHHGLATEVQRAARLASALYGTTLPPTWRVRNPWDGWYSRRLLARNGWGRPTRPLLQLMFYIRSHWLRMPPIMLARHLWTKWRRGAEA